MNTQISNASPAFSAPSSTSPRKRRKGPRGVMPLHVTVAFSEDGATARVPLQGAYGRGKIATLDAPMWSNFIAPTFGTAWGVNYNGKRASFQICRANPRVASAAHQHGPRPKANLARIIAGAGPGECVWYRDRDPLNLQKSNLEVISRTELMSRNCGSPADA